MSLFALLIFLAAPRLAAAQDTYLLLVTGVSGEDTLAAQYQKWGASIVDGAKKRGVAAANITYLAEAVDKDPARIKGRSTKEGVTQAIDDIAKRAKPGDEVFILLIGHGTFDNSVGSFNLPGPDLNANDFKSLLERLLPQRVAFVNTTSSSGAFLEPLKGPQRVIVTATRTGGERLDTKFPGFFVEALDTDAADSDKNGRISIGEAFEYAKNKVTASYEQGGNILTEHAMLEDGAQGKLASSVFLAPQRTRDAATTAAAAADPQLKALLDQQDALERQVSELRLKKDQMDPAQYDAQLEKLLTDLALKTREIRARQGQKN
ncbi:MAG TPA: C13 family peptidase [Vicinamibacterales bacterium]|nr:C13 family peptidase [Vicinamibacterales bacterium]